MDEQVYMTLRTIKQNLNERIKEYYKRNLNLETFYNTWQTLNPKPYMHFLG
jgi:hypothetical protein